MKVYDYEVPNSLKCVKDTYVNSAGTKVLVEKEVWVVEN